MQIADEIVMVPIENIIPYDNNPRNNSKTVELLVKAIPRVGFNVPLVLDSENVIVKGHARYLAAKRLNMTEVPCVYSYADPETIKADRISDNKVFEFTKWEEEELQQEINSINIDLSEFGLEASINKSFVEETENVKNDEILEEQKQRYHEIYEQLEQKNAADITTAKHKQKEEEYQEDTAQKTYLTVSCENCGHTIYFRKGDYVTWG